MTGKQIQIPTGDSTFEAYLSAPAAGKAPGVLLVTSIFGLTDGMKATCDDLTRRGCVALAPNYFWRDEDSGVLEMANFQRAVARAERIDFDQSMDDVRRGIAELQRHPN